MNSPFRYPRAVRAMHALIALAIVTQMLLTLVMQHPSTKRAMTPQGAFYFQWHEWVGLAAFTVLAANWIYRVARWKQAGRRLFPWSMRAGRSELGRELGLFARLRWRSIPLESALAGTVHGLGILLASEFVLTGSVLYILLWPANQVTPLASKVMEVHQFLGPAMWAYLAGHGAMAVWHQFAGDGSISRMFSPRN